ncbi:hypothetical protein BG006_000904 [Podila minutissima]|uniref:Transmembrane protein n=1 Tax=Podila minutissima TaxID=64525 RepID=A0A9P5SAV7_9FUNG|nr:hypothetical protein BG006_000904 [Podila minutissima]
MDPQNPAPSSTSTAISSYSDAARYDANSGYIYVVLVTALLAALIFFGRAALARRKERLRALKDPDYESGPPTYNRHVQDLQVVEDLSVPETALVRGEHYYIITPRTTNTHCASGHSSRRHQRSRSMRPVVVVSVDHGDSSRTMVVETTTVTTTTATLPTDPTLPTYDDVIVQNQSRPASTQVVARPARSSSLSLPTLPDPPSYVATLAPTREEA